MPRFTKGSQEAKDYMKSIREKRTTTSTTDYETSKGKKSQKNIVINLDKEVETLPSGEKIVKMTKRTKQQPQPQQEQQSEPVITPAEITSENSILSTKKPRQKYSNDEERKKAKREQTLASNKRKREERKQARLEGDGVVKDIIESAKKAGRKTKKAFEKGAEVISDTAKNLAQKTQETAQKVIKDVKEYGTAVVKGRGTYPPKVRDILDKYGEEEVSGLTIMRTPVPSVLTGALSLFSAGEFGRRMKNSFDTLFHLFLEIRTKSGKRISVEKNEVINMDLEPKKRPETESKVVSSIPSGLSINEMMNNTKEYQGEKFFKYSASSNNCQHFIVAIFKSNNIGDDEDIKFIKQDTEQLFKDLPYLRKIANTVTDLGASVNTAITGKGTYKKDYVTQSVIFDKDKYSLVEARRWLIRNGHFVTPVDSKGEFYRFRQLRPDVVEKMGFTEYRTKELGDGSVKLVLVYKNKISKKNIKMPRGIKGSGAIPTQVIVEKEMSGSGMCCSMCGCEMDHEMTGGKIKVSKALKKLGRDIKKGIEKEVINPIKKDVQREFIDPAKQVVEGDIGGYVTAKKGGLASDLVKFGIPAVTGGLAGLAGTALSGGNPVAGMAASAIGSKLGSLASKEVAKATGTGMPKRKGRFEKGSPEARAHMDMIRKMKNK